MFPLISKTGERAAIAGGIATRGGPCARATMREAVPLLNTERRNDHVLTSEQSSRETSRPLVAYLVPYFIVAA